MGVAQHEFSEILGRLPGFSYNGTYYTTSFDLYRYTAPGTRNLNPNATGVYFSTDTGNTAAKYFNPPGNGGDISDWASGSNDASNAFGSSGVTNPLTAVDIAALSSLGWQSSGAAQSPGGSANVNPQLTGGGRASLEPLDLTNSVATPEPSQAIGSLVFIAFAAKFFRQRHRPSAKLNR
jgi:hypothetical protein